MHNTNPVKISDHNRKIRCGMHQFFSNIQETMQKEGKPSEKQNLKYHVYQRTIEEQHITILGEKNASMQKFLLQS